MVCFPTNPGLGLSETARTYALADAQEATDYLAHPVLGTRLLEICQALLGLASNDAHRIFGSPDDLKLKSSMTLFASLGTNPVFQRVLDKFCHSARDDKTLRILAAPRKRPFRPRLLVLRAPHQPHRAIPHQ